MQEAHLLTGPLEPTNEPYAIAKIAGISLCEAYNRQYGTQFLAAMPTNLYGPNDNFDLKNSHVLAALIRKFSLSKAAADGRWDVIDKDRQVFGPIPDGFLACLIAIAESNGHRLPGKCSTASKCAQATAAVVLWGTGNPRREFLHVDDLASACVFLMNLGDSEFQHVLTAGSKPIVNVGCGQDITIKELATMISNIVQYDGSILWDENMPDGTPRKLLDISEMARIGFKPQISLEHGIQSVVTWYQSQLARNI
jgi:GDP-L-fucose synthase